MKVERTVDLTAPPQTVYDLIMDPTRLEDWVTIHHHLEEASPAPLKKGSRVHQCLKLAGKKFKVHWTVVENRPCEQVVWEGKGPVFSRARVIYGFERQGDGTRFSYSNEYDLPGGPVGRVAGRTVSRVTGKEVDGSLRKLKSLVE